MAKFVILFSFLTHKNTHAYIFIIVPHTFHKCTASLHSAEMNFWGDDVNHTLITNINNMPELVGFSSDFAQVPAMSYQASQTGDSENEMKLMLQDMKNEMDRKLNTVVEMMASRNEEVMRQIGMLSEKIDNLALRRNHKELGSGMCMGQASGMVAPIGAYQVMNKGKEQALMSPGLIYADGALRLNNTPHGVLDRPQNMGGMDLVNAQGLCLFSETALKGAKEGASVSVKPYGENDVEDDVDVSPGISVYDFMDTEDFTQYY